MEQQKLPPILLARLELEFEGDVVCSLPLADPADKMVRIETAPDWEKWLDQQGIKSKRHRRIITEGALMGGLLAQGIPVTLSIVSDDAGQFNVFDHALCWIHAERIINRLIPLNAEHIKAVDDTREQLWQLYRDLKTYKLGWCLRLTYKVELDRKSTRKLTKYVPKDPPPWRASFFSNVQNHPSCATS
jgi:hypothetical protein